MRTGFNVQTRATIIEREGYRCGRCGDLGNQIHHRRPRGMGGPRGGKTYQAINSIPNGVLLCVACHNWVESHRIDARGEGFLLTYEQTPSRTPVLYRGEWTLLDPEGGLQPAASP